MGFWKAGEFICIAWQRKRGKRVRHWHWPKRDIVNCENARDIARTKLSGGAGAT
jgi:hypothetical protein